MLMETDLIIKLCYTLSQVKRFEKNYHVLDYEIIEYDDWFYTIMMGVRKQSD